MTIMIKIVTVTNTMTAIMMKGREGEEWGRGRRIKK